MMSAQKKRERKFDIYPISLGKSEFTYVYLTVFILLGVLFILQNLLLNFFLYLFLVEHQVVSGGSHYLGKLRCNSEGTQFQVSLQTLLAFDNFLTSYL